jgi:hypothetical protein
MVGRTKHHAEWNQAVLGHALLVEIEEHLVVGVESAEEPFAMERPVELRTNTNAGRILVAAVAPAPLDAVAERQRE